MALKDQLSSCGRFGSLLLLLFLLLFLRQLADSLTQAHCFLSVVPSPCESTFPIS